MTNKPQWRVTAVLTEVRIQFKSFSASAHKEIVPHTTVGEKKKVLAVRWGGLVEKAFLHRILSLDSL